jgi:hypothetical protein
MKVSYGSFVSVAASLLITGAELTHMAGLRLELESNQPASPRAQWAAGHYPPPAGWMNALLPSA